MDLGMINYKAIAADQISCLLVVPLRNTYTRRSE